MAKRKASLIVRMTDGADGVKAKSLTNINPDASLAELKTLAQGLVSLTDRSYVGSTRIEQTDTTYVKPWPTAYSPVSFWFGSTKFTDQDNMGTDGTHGRVIEFDVTQAGVVHEGGFYKFHFEVKGLPSNADTAGPWVFAISNEHSPREQPYWIAGCKVHFELVSSGAYDENPTDERIYDGGRYVFYEIPDTFTEDGKPTPPVAITGTDNTNSWQFCVKPVRGN